MVITTGFYCYALKFEKVTSHTGWRRFLALALS